MNRVTEWLNWKPAMAIHTLFFSLSLLQRDFYFGQLWFIINCFVLVALIRAAYGESSSNRLVAWYLYSLSIFTDVVSLSVFGRIDKDHRKVYSDFGFCLVMAIILLVPKPLFAIFLWKQLKDEGVDIRRGIRATSGALADQTYKGVDSDQTYIDTSGQQGIQGTGSMPGQYGFADNTEEQQQQQPTAAQVAQDANDIFSNIPPPTNEVPQTDNNQYGDFAPGGSNV